MREREEKYVQNFDWTTQKKKRPLGICRHKSKYNIRIDFNATGWECVDWIPLAWEETNGGFF
jgi:hypothetical protein